MTLNHQEIFNEVYTKFVSDPFLSKNDDPTVDNQVSCFYRHPMTGKPCLIGRIIPDSLYKPSLEGAPAAMAWELVHHVDLFFEDRRFLNYLQECHDNALDVVECLANLKQFALNYDLTIPDVPVHSSLT